ncbi:MAG: hypothetical protein ACK5NI_00935 [bacterium]
MRVLRSHALDYDSNPDQDQDQDQDQDANQGRIQQRLILSMPSGKTAPSRLNTTMQQINKLEREEAELNAQIEAATKRQIQMKLDMFQARAQQRRQIEAGELKPSPVRYDWDFNRLLVALPGEDYVPREECEED